MYLLNRAGIWGTVQRAWFTFHYVSIKSRWTLSAKYTLKSFTFHYVSIKSSSLPVLLFLFRNLHSTMYLLNRAGDFRHSPLWRDLHSTMYLLNPEQIKEELLAWENLHSTMYLLNRCDAPTTIQFVNHLHSTMYLLNLMPHLKTGGYLS